MKLIDAPIGIFRFDGELVLKTEYCSENKLSGKYIPDCYIVRTGEYFWGGAKTANELNNLDVEPVDFAELLPTVTDTISRQAAIEAVQNRHMMLSKEKVLFINDLEKLPSVEDGERGDNMKWITLTKFTDGGKAYVNASQICAVYEKYNDKNVTIVDFVGDDEKYLEVLESPEAIMNLIKGAVTT